MGTVAEGLVIVFYTFFSMNLYLVIVN